jgi:ATP-dependent DNA helicase DinG
VRATIKLRWQDRAAQEDFAAALAACADASAGAARAAAAVAGASPDLDKLAERARSAARIASLFAEPVQDGQVRWIDLGVNQVRVVESPLDIREALREQRSGSRKAWVFTSATLGDDARLSWFTESAGLDDATVLRVESPFDYAHHARLYVPRVFPKPGDAAHAEAVAALAARCASALGGRSFVLTTTLRALPLIGERLQALLEADDIDVLLQGRAPRRGRRARCRAPPRGRRAQPVRRLLRRRCGGVAEAGRGTADPQRERSRPARRLRPAAGQHGLRCPLAPGPAADGPAAR